MILPLTALREIPTPVLSLDRFDEDDLYEALDDLWARQDKIEKAFWRNYLARRGTPPALFVYDVTSSL